MKKSILLLMLSIFMVNGQAQTNGEPEYYYPEGTKWTEIRLDTLKYDSWYSKVGDEWVPNFETVEYYVKGFFKSDPLQDEPFMSVYTDGPEWTDSLTLLLDEQDGHSVLASVLEPDVDGNYHPMMFTIAYEFDWEVGMMVEFKTIIHHYITYIFPPGFFDFGRIQEIKEGDFGGVRPLKYADVNGVRIIQGIGVTTWNNGECLFGPVNPYEALSFFKQNTGQETQSEPELRNYRSMLVHFERNGEVLYDVWPEKESPKTPQTDIAYRPFIEEGKVWKLGWYEDGADPTTTEPKRIEYQYFNGDTILFDTPYKKLMTAEVEGEHTQVQYAGALRENEGIVSICPSNYHYYNNLYDFVSADGTSNLIMDTYIAIRMDIAVHPVYSVKMGKKSFIDTETYKGCCREVIYDGETINWLQGVGNMGLYNLTTSYMGFYRLMSCTVGDEVLYYDSSLMPQSSEAKKKKLDFTHVIKAQPKAPRRNAEEEGTETLKGEYSVSELFVHLNGLAGKYAVTLTDAAGQEVYAKEVLTDNVLALNTALSSYNPGDYTLTVENEYEKYVTTLSLTPDMIESPSWPLSSNERMGAIYDLQGRRLEKAPQKGVYIQSGKLRMKN